MDTARTAFDAHQDAAEASSPRPPLSVIVALADHRGRAIACIRSWTAGQRGMRHLFELVVVADGTEPELHAPVQAMLWPHDQFVVAAGSPIALLGVGAARARGDILLFTEAHCEAVRGIADEVLRHFAESGIDGGSLASDAPPHNRVARMENRNFERHVAPTRAPGAWNRVLLRGFAVRRDCYFAAGGFRPELDLFAEPALAMALHRQGRRLEFIDGARVVHHSNTSIRDAYESVYAYVHGRCVLRAEAPADYERYFGVFEEWRHRGGASARLARAAWADCARAAARDSHARRLALHGLARLAPAAAFGRLAVALPGAARLAVALARCWLWHWNGKRLADADDNLHLCMVAHARMMAVLRFPASAPRPLGLGRAAVDDLGDEELYGFQPVETHAAGRFRWTAPIASVPLDLAPGRYRIVLETRGLRPALEAEALAAALNGRTLPRAAIATDGASVSLDIAVAPRWRRPHRLLLLSAPMRQRNVPDPRPLGLPVFAIEIRPL